MRKILLSALFFTMVLLNSANAFSAEKILSDFEKDDGGWGVPDWCFEKGDYVCKTSSISADVSNTGTSSLKLLVDFPGNAWKAGIAEYESDGSGLEEYGTISCSFYIPKTAPSGIKAKLILTVEDGSEWLWVETMNTIDLTPSEWTVLAASIKSGSRDWMRPLGSVISGGSPNDPKVSGAQVYDVKDGFRANIRKIGVRVESDKTGYAGPVYIDTIKVSE